MAFQAAFQSSWESLSAWVSALILVLSPVWQLLVVLAGAVWPHLRKGMALLWRYQVSLPVSTIYAEIAVVVFVVVCVLLRRFIVRRRYLPRARQRVRRFRARMDRGYLAFTASVERNLRLSARAFPHVMYWTGAVLFAWLAPVFAANLRDNLWVSVTVTWPTVYALYLALVLRSQGGAIGTVGEARRSRAWESPPAATTTAVARVSSPRRTQKRSPKSPGEANLAGAASVMPHDVDRVLMYWVVYTMARCCAVLTGYVPFASSVLQSMATPVARTGMFFLVVWMHLPGPGSGLQASESCCINWTRHAASAGRVLACGERV